MDLPNVDGEEIVSMVDVLEEDAALEEEANAVLGGSDDQNCTYPDGYIDRQALYACITCCGVDSSPAGVCLACSLHCHDKHELVELYTKRNFRCDCGNGSFKDFECKLYKEKDPENANNKYNQNFKGTYCTCKRPYPDEEDEIEDEMIQCIVCEDWYHSRHLGTLAPADYLEMVCDSCVTKNGFLQYYSSLTVPSGMTSSSQQIVKREDTSKDVEVVGEASPSKTKENVVLKGTSCDKNEVEVSQKDKDENSKEDTDASKENDIIDCKLEALKKEIKLPKKVAAMFWPTQWRKSLCKCEPCMILYKEHGMEFITSDADTLEEYERKAKESRSDSYDNAMSALGRMGRLQQLEVVQGFNDMRSELSDYLKGFAGEGKVVRKEDIEEFFEGLRERKRRRLDDGFGFQMNCR